MAGSYNHAVNKETGKLYGRGLWLGMGTLEDAYETLEEMYGMIHYLADLVEGDGRFQGLVTPEQIIEEARKNYREGLALSPGVLNG